MGKGTIFFQAWAMALPIRYRLRVYGYDPMVIRSLGGSSFLTECPGCDHWLNIPQPGAVGKAELGDGALWGPLSCHTCETDLMLSRRGVKVLRMGNAQVRRPAPPKPPREKKPPRPRKFELWDEDAGDHEP